MIPPENPSSSPLNEYSDLFNAPVVNKRCGNCGAETIMNARYAQYVPGDLLSCRHCRKPGTTDDQLARSLTDRCLSLGYSEDAQL